MAKLQVLWIGGHISGRVWGVAVEVGAGAGAGVQVGAGQDLHSPGQHTVVLLSAVPQ